MPRGNPIHHASHQQANSQLAGLATRMERLANGSVNSGKDTESAASEVLVEALMVIAHTMPDEPKKQIGRLLSSYDQV